MGLQSLTDVAVRPDADVDHLRPRDERRRYTEAQGPEVSSSPVASSENAQHSVYCADCERPRMTLDTSLQQKDKRIALHGQSPSAAGIFWVSDVTSHTTTQADVTDRVDNIRQDGTAA